MCRTIVKISRYINLILFDVRLQAVAMKEVMTIILWLTSLLMISSGKIHYVVIIVYQLYIGLMFARSAITPPNVNRFG